MERGMRRPREVRSARIRPRSRGIAPMTKLFGIFSGTDRDHINADIAVGGRNSLTMSLRLLKVQPTIESAAYRRVVR
jgi:hypothetical protein